VDKLRAIKFFCRAVEAKSFTSAAHALDVPPSVLSKFVSALETELRFTLFNRSTRRLSLTEAGTAYYEYCRQLLLDMEEAETGRCIPQGLCASDTTRSFEPLCATGSANSWRLTLRSMSSL
jgi:DNA-binding transcriptional LysR family regulator